MTSPVEEVLTRLGELQPLIAGVNATLLVKEHERIDPTLLPAFINRPGLATRTSPNRNQLVTTRTIRMALVVSKIADGKDEAKEVAYEDCYPFLDSVPEFFMKHPRLELNGIGLPFISNTTLALPDDGPQRMAWGGDTFSAILYRLPFEYSKLIT